MEWDKVARKFLIGVILGLLGTGAVLIPTDQHEAIATAGASLLIGLASAGINYWKHRKK